jgi:glycosyltransferase involved in cell wall biosynthesis
MKILVCTFDYPPHGSGIGNVAHNVVEQLKKKGIECVVCTPKGPDIKLGSLELIKKIGILGLLYYWYNVFELLNKRNEYDAIWLHNPLFIREFTFKKNCLVTIHYTYFGDVKRKATPRIYYWVASKIEKFCLKKIQNCTISCVSQQLCKEMYEIDPHFQHNISILNGVNIDKFTTQKNTNIREELKIESGYTLLYIGRLASNKFVDVVIRSMPEILTQHTDTKLLIVGDGPQKEYLNDLSKKIGVTQSVFFCGVQPSNKIQDYYAAADIVICPYSGLVLFEAMAAGKPIIAFDFEWHSEVITNLNNGMLVKAMDEHALAQAVIHLLIDDKLKQDLGKNARDYSVKYLDWKIITQKYFEEFNTLINKK